MEKGRGRAAACCPPSLSLNGPEKEGKFYGCGSVWLLMGLIGMTRADAAAP